MEKGVKIAGIISASVIIITLIIAYIIFQFVPANTVSVNGQSEIKATPDLVTINFDIQARGITASKAKDSADEIFTKLINSLKQLGIKEEEIKTTNLNVNPEYDWINGKRVDKGYLADHYITIELSTENSDKISGIIEAGVDAGALLSYINFELSQILQNEKKAEAIKLATEDARIRADAIASGLGKKLGDIVSVSDSNFNYSPWPLYKASTGVDMAESASLAKEATAQINPSEQIVYGNVAVIYKIKG